MTHTKPLTLPAANHWVVGEIARLEAERNRLVTRMTQDASDIDGIDLLLAELDLLRTRC